MPRRRRSSPRKSPRAKSKKRKEFIAAGGQTGVLGQQESQRPAGGDKPGEVRGGLQPKEGMKPMDLIGKGNVGKFLDVFDIFKKRK